MKGFEFKLQKLLDIRISDEQDIKVKYAKVQSEENIVKNKLENLKSSYTKFCDINNCESILEQKIRANYLSAVLTSIDETSNELYKKQEEVNLVRERLINKQVERKSLEKIKDNKFNSYKKEIDIKEQARNDEYAIYSYYRNKSQIA